MIYAETDLSSQFPFYDRQNSRMDHKIPSPGIYMSCLIPRTVSMMNFTYINNGLCYMAQLTLK